MAHGHPSTPHALPIHFPIPWAAPYGHSPVAVKATSHKWLVKRKPAKSVGRKVHKFEPLHCLGEAKGRVLAPGMVYDKKAYNLKNSATERSNKCRVNASIKGSEKISESLAGLTEGFFPLEGVNNN